MRLFGVDAGRQGGGACQPTVPMPQFILGREAEQGGGKAPRFSPLFYAYFLLIPKFWEKALSTRLFPLILALISIF